MNRVRNVVRFAVRTIAGLALIALGLFLAIPGIPGPGVPVVLIGLAILDWPGKASFFHWLSRFSWFTSLNDWTTRRIGYRFPGGPQPL